MLNQEDVRQIEARGSRIEDVVSQIEYFKKGFPFLPVVNAAETGSGIIQVTESEIPKYLSWYEKGKESGISILKFVPASGAASRMFKSLFSALDDLMSGMPEEEVLAANRDARECLERLEDFAFYPELKESVENSGEEQGMKLWLECLLTGKGLNYGSLPKGLLQFHSYGQDSRTPFEEHLVEGALYARDTQDVVRLHFTVSPEHEEGFFTLIANVKSAYEASYGVSLEVSFSRQKPSTDTIAVGLDNEPFREKDGALLFRPGGHGALLENLNDLDADVVFIKNIDNVVPDRLKEHTVTWKKVLAGLLLHYQEKIFVYQKELEKYPSALESGFLAEAAGFLENVLCVKPAENQYYTEKEDLVQYLREKFNRPLRVCGMVKNLGEPGGGPFWALNSDGTTSLQIAESVQIDTGNPVQVKIARNATHFNPVDLVCGLKNHKGEKYELMKFRDPMTGFISQKSKDGKELKAQELPGLWNGAMSDWNTIFIEVPVITFNPVKTVNDLLRDEHQPVKKGDI